jgi:pimeloyl-ACP methyl ester carboxylesterase
VKDAEPQCSRAATKTPCHLQGCVSAVHRHLETNLKAKKRKIVFKKQEVPLLFYHLIRLDIHGHGESGFRAPLTLEDMAADYYQLLTKLNLPNVSWVGHSIRGMLGMRLALADPEAIDSLILIATTAQLDPAQRWPWLTTGKFIPNLSIERTRNRLRLLRVRSMERLVAMEP